MSNWKTLKVVVEIPIQGPLTEGDLRWKIENMLVKGGLSSYFVNNGCRVGHLQVKRLSKVLTSLERSK